MQHGYFDDSSNSKKVPSSGTKNKRLEEDG